MRLATSYDAGDTWYFEYCSRAPLDAMNCIYPDVGCLHQGYNIPKVKGATQADAAVKSLAKAEAFLPAEAARSAPIWDAAKRQEETRLRAAAKQQALKEQLLAEERAKLKAGI